MVVNHFPIIGNVLGLGILISGLFLKNNTIKNVAYSIFILAAIFAFSAMYTGEGAEEIVEDMPNIGHKIIHEHEELAEKFVISSYILGVFSILGLFANLKKHGKSKLISFFILLISLVTAILSRGVGNSGGEIRHTEIREKTVKVLNIIKKNKNKIRKKRIKECL